MAWADLEQGVAEGEGAEGSGGHDFKFFFPGLKKWNLALRLADGTAYFPEPETWEVPKGVL